MTAGYQGSLKERSTRNQVFKENMGSIAGQLGVRRDITENSKMQAHEAGRNTLVEREQDAQQPTVIKTEASIGRRESQYIIAGCV